MKYRIDTNNYLKKGMYQAPYIAPIIISNTSSDTNSVPQQDTVKVAQNVITQNHYMHPIPKHKTQQMETIQIFCAILTLHVSIVH